MNGKKQSILPLLSEFVSFDLSNIVVSYLPIRVLSTEYEHYDFRGPQTCSLQVEYPEYAGTACGGECCYIDHNVPGSEYEDSELWQMSCFRSQDGHPKIGFITSKGPFSLNPYGCGSSQHTLSIFCDSSFDIQVIQVIQVDEGEDPKMITTKHLTLDL